MLKILMALCVLAFADDVQLWYSETGAWSGSPGGYAGEVRVVPPMGPAAPESFANWVVGLPKSNQPYILQATWVPVKDGASNVIYKVYEGDRLLGSFGANQRIPPSGEKGSKGIVFQELGRFTPSGTTVRVILSNRGANGNVVADALRIKPGF